MRAHPEHKHPPNSIDPLSRWEDEGGAVPHPSPEDQDARIRSRAYDIYRSRCARAEPGDASSDWARAEQDVRAGRDR